MRIGHGYDVHKLVEGRDLILGGVKIPYPIDNHRSTVQLISAVSGISGNLTHGYDFHTVFRAETKAKGVPLEHHAFQCAAFVFQGKIMMTRRVHLIVADLTPDRQIGKFGVSIH